MAYATLSDLTIFGPDRLAQLAWPDRSGQADGALLVAIISGDDTDDWTEEQIAAGQAAVSKIEKEMENAATIIDASLALNHTLPLSNPPEILKIWNGDITIYRLHNAELSETDPVVTRYHDAQAGLKKVEQGILRFESQTPTSATIIQFSSAAAQFRRSDF